MVRARRVHKLCGPTTTNRGPERNGRGSQLFLDRQATQTKYPDANSKMLTQAILALALAATGLAQAPEGYQTVYITSKVNTKFVVVPTTAATGSGVVVKTAANTTAQQWYIQEGSTKVQLANTELCLDAGAKTNWRDMATISIKACDAASDSQKWVRMADGRIALEMSSPQECLDLQYMRATENNPVGLYNCQGLGNAGAADAGLNWPLAVATP
ncbi:ricin B lectin domain-containing protein [Hypoxylon sp. NC1633]|nr:ricin B lectin domain-containing protein [Hypoxylon sp. NC1633]